ncbi:MAG TPA: OmpH family outer membrane protein [Dissulfurispiraceae bacterium]|nr:OmpH family outer membrane protein [Dissulfurispiraceae bacterium]
MKKIVLVMMVGFAILLNGALSRVNAADMKLGFVDIDRAANDSEEGKKAVIGLKDFMSSRQSTISERGKDIEKMKSDLDKQGAIMSPDAKKAKIEEVERSEREFQRMVSDANQEFEKKRRELTESVYKEIIDIVVKFGQEEKYTVILPVQSLLYSDKALDITDIIIKKFNERKGVKPAAGK